MIRTSYFGTALIAVAFAVGFGERVAAQPVNVPASKVAVIYPDAFLDGKTGIAKYSKILADLNREFQPRQTELQQLQQRITTLTDELMKISNSADASSVAVKREQLEQMNRDFKRKGEDGEAAFGKRRQQLFAPLQLEVGNALEAFAKANGIGIIIDGGQSPILYASGALDITRAFINEFNSKNPVTPAPPEE